MVQAVRSFSEGCQRRLGITVTCRPCNRQETFYCSDFTGYIAPGANIEALIWRCQKCHTPSEYVRYVMPNLLDTIEVKRWKPTHSMVRRWP